MSEILKYGSRGNGVAIMQNQLIAYGFDIVADGIFGKKTESAVKQFQQANGLVVDGIVGRKTRTAIAGEHTGKLLKEADIVAAAELLGVDVAAVKAVNRVESRGNGFLADGRCVILFERHIFYREYAKKYGKEAAQSLCERRPDLCNPRAGGYVGGAAEWPRLNAAVLYDKTAALKAASFGLFQIMGFNFAAAGFDDVEAFAAAMELSEGEQLAAFVRFIKSNKRMHTALKNHDWAAFAAAYNGAEYKRNAYDSKLAHAYSVFANELGAA